MIDKIKIFNSKKNHCAKFIVDSKDPSKFAFEYKVRKKKP